MPLTTGLNNSVSSLATFDDDGPGPTVPALYVGGTFSYAGGHSSAAVARWGCPAVSFCYPNCDQSTVPPVLNVNDFTCFLNHYAAGTSYANCDASTTVPILNVNDFTCFLNKFAAGCP